MMNGTWYIYLFFALAEKLLKNHSDRCNKLVRYFFVLRLSRLENLKLSRIRSHKTRSPEIKIQVPNYVFNQSTRDKPRSDELQSLHRRLIEFWFELKSFSLCKEQSNEAILSHLNREFTCMHHSVLPIFEFYFEN